MKNIAKKTSTAKPGGGGYSVNLNRSEETAQKPSLTQDAYQRIRIDILEGHFGAGRPLRLEALKMRYGLSFSPLREALNRLQSERLVVATALRGFRVAEISRAEMWDSIETRILVETEALRRSIKRGGDDWEGSVVAAFHALSRCAARIAAGGRKASDEDRVELEGRHHNFHSSLVAACGSRWLTELAAQFYAQTERYRRPMLGTDVSAWPKGRNIHDEHEAIMNAALARDAGRAADLLSAHYRKTGQLIEKQFDDVSDRTPAIITKRKPENASGRPLKRVSAARIR